MGIFDRVFGKPSVATFADRMIRAARIAGDTREHRYDDVQKSITTFTNGEATGTVNLHNMYRNYCELPRSARNGYLQVCVRGMLAPKHGLPDDFESAGPNIRPRVWARTTIENMRLGAMLNNPGGESDLPHIGIGDHLVGCLAYHWPETVQTITAENLKAWGTTFYEAMEQAIENLGATRFGYVEIGDNLYGSLTGDACDASRVLLLDRITAFAVRGSHVVLLPNREQLLITGSEDELGLRIMADLAEQGLDKPYSLSGTPLMLVDGEWVDWMPPPENPLYRRFRDLEVKSRYPDYNDQKGLLDQLHEKQGLEVYTASFSVAQKEGDPHLTSYCVWGDGVDALLPVVQKVMFVGLQGTAAIGEWERVRAVVGDLMEETEHYPPRYRVRTFPDGKRLAEIGMAEL